MEEDLTLQEIVLQNLKLENKIIDQLVELQKKYEEMAKDLQTLKQTIGGEKWNTNK